MDTARALVLSSLGGVSLALCFGWASMGHANPPPTASPAMEPADAEDAALEESTATWQRPRPADVRAQAFAWLSDRGAEPSLVARATEVWADVTDQSTGADLLDRLARTFALVDKNIAALVEFCEVPKGPLVLPSRPWLTDPKTPPLVSNNMRLLYGRWLVHQSLFDEARQALADLKPEDVVAPDLLLFYQGAASHTLLDREGGLQAIERLLEVKSHMPRRYAVIAQLMQQDLERLDEESLDHIARRMGDIRRRLDLGRAGKKVQEVERGVVESLDKIIKKLEEQQQQASGAGGESIRSSSPAQDSQIIGGKGKGEVVKRNVGSQAGWGDLPPKEREEAMQQIGHEFPSHYRDVIEQYFRRLAAEEGK